MEWLVKIIGNNFDLEELSKSFNSPDMNITRDTSQEGKNFILKSVEFQLKSPVSSKTIPQSVPKEFPR